MKVRRILVTGPEQSGKSPVVKTASNIFSGKILAIPEAASMLLENKFPRPGRDISYSPSFRDIFQRTIYNCQVSYEAIYTLLAEERGISVVLCDRGKLDGIAYRDEEDIEEAKRLFCEEHGIVFEEELAEYEMIIHLESIVSFNPAEFVTEGETFRVIPGNEVNAESRHEMAVKSALRLDRRLLAIYSPHDWHVVLPASIGVEGKIAAVAGIVRALLAKKT